MGGIMRIRLSTITSLAVAGIAGRDAPNGAAAGRAEGDRSEDDGDEELAGGQRRQGYAEGWETPSSLETASSRVA